MLDVSENSLLFDKFEEISQRCPKIETLIMRNLQTFVMVQNSGKIQFENLVRLDLSETFKGDDGNFFIEDFFSKNDFASLKVLKFDGNQISSNYFSKLLSYKGLKNLKILSIRNKGWKMGLIAYPE